LSIISFAMTKTFQPITGSIPALVTPMLADGSVDYDTLRKLIDWHIAEGTDCIGVVGTTGESPTVNVEEHREIIRVSVEQAKGRVPIMAGCGANSTAEAIELAKFAKSVGADCQLQVVPYYNKPTQEGLYQHFKAIAEAVPDLPIILYNVPGRSVADMQHETVLRLAQVPGIVGIKEATGNIERAQWLIRDLPKEFAVYSGDDPTAVALMLCGGKGNVSGRHRGRCQKSHGNSIQTDACAQKFVCRSQPYSRQMGHDSHGLVRRYFAFAHDRTLQITTARGRSRTARQRTDLSPYFLDLAHQTSGYTRESI
jgi:4-hydroxy-tetrahydrodipicolinate synthase